MVEEFEPKVVAEITEPPIVDINQVVVGITSNTEGASIGYKIYEDNLQLYTLTFLMPEAEKVTAKAIRYGWVESQPTRLNIQ
jgi:hypothetical protein